MNNYGFLFPGQGSQYIGMGKNLYDNFQIAKDIFNEANEALQFNIAKLCFEGPVEQLNLTENSQPAILTVSYAAYQVFRSLFAINPSFMAGHSLGEYTALVSAKSVKFFDMVKVVRARGRFMQSAVPIGLGAMAAILGLAKDKVEEACEEAARDSYVQPANYNCPGQIVISGYTKGVEIAVNLARLKGAFKAIQLAVSAPFHSKLMEPAAKKLADEFNYVEVSDPIIPVFSNVSAEPNYKKDNVRELLIKQVSSAVRWEESMTKMLQLGVDSVIEFGPGRVLSGLMKKINKNVNITNIENVANLNKIENEVKNA